jgi:MoxR-like ATPase
VTDKAFQDAHQKLAKARGEIGKVIFGQVPVIDQTLVTLVSGGHLLLIGVPGLAKTLLVDTTAKVFGLSASRVQCTPDLMPADILGSEVLEEDESGKRSFRFIKGPIFTQLLMADEINRASPRTQSALLQAMQEKEVTVSGKAYDVPEPFHVLATQNPIEQEGTYPLPEAQLDRFLMQIDVDYPERSAERDMLMATTTNNVRTANAVLTSKDLMDIQKLVRDMPIGDKVVDAILTLVRRGRPDASASDTVKEYVAWAPGPRAAQGLMLAVRARALIEGRETPSVDDVIDLAEPILKHRMALNYKARGGGITLQSVIRSLTENL